MTKTEKNNIFDLAMRYDFAAGIESDDKLYQTCYRTIDHFDAMYRIMTELNIEDEYDKYVDEHKEQLAKWKNGDFVI